MAIAYLAEGDPITITEANSVFDAADNALRVLFNGQSPLLYKPYSGSSSYQEAGLAGVLFVFGTQASRVIFSGTASHDQPAIDTATAAASVVGTPDHTLKQVELDLAAGYLGNSLVAQTRLTTPPSGPDEDYWVKVEFVTGYYHHEKIHELAVADVVFEGHAARTFTWLEEWNKFRCIRFHNLDADATDLVVTMEETGDTITLPRWSCKTVRRSADGTAWDEVGFLLWRMREDDLTRFGGVMPWNDRRRATSGATSDSVWTSDGANNVASWAMLWWVLDYFSVPITPPEVSDECGDGLADAFDNRTGLWFDLSDITRNAGTLSPYPSPTDDATPIYQLAWHGGRMLVYTYNADTTSSWASGSPTISSLLAGDAATGLTLEVDVGGNSAHLVLTVETGKDYADVLPIGTNLGASGHPFTVDADGTGYNVPAATDGIWSGIKRLADDTEETETVVGIGGNASTDYTRAKAENASDGSVTWNPFDATIGDVRGWAFDDATKNNDHCTFMSNSVKCDSRRLAVDVEVEVDPVDGRAPTDSAAANFCGSATSTLQECILAEFGKLNWFQTSTIQEWPPAPWGGAWLTPNYARRSKPVVDDSLALANPHTQNYLGRSDGGDWAAFSGTAWPIPLQLNRQLPVNGNSGSHNVEDAALTCCYFTAPDSMKTILANYATTGWWASNRTDAIAGTVLSGETRDVIAIPIRARHFNVLAQRLNALLMVTPFSFFDAVYYGREFRPDYSSGGIFGGHVYPYGFVCYSTGTAATRASALSITVRDFQTEFGGYGGYADMDIDGRYGSGSTSAAFDQSAGTGWNAWNKDLPRWFYPAASLDRNESAQIDSASPGSGWVQGELAYTITGTDFYWWQYDNDGAFDFPDFDYLRADDLASAASSLGIPFRLLRLFASWEPYQFLPDRVGLGCKVCPVVGGGTATREEVRLVPAIISEAFVCFAGTDDRWGPNGIVRVSDWPACPATQGSDDAVIQQSNADPMHGLNRSGSGDVIEYPYGFTPATGTPDTTWENDCPWQGEARHLSFENYDTSPTPPAGWSAAVNRLASYPVPITEWGATDIESHAAPSCDCAWIRLSDMGQKFDAADLWAEQGSGSWGGEGAFAVHLMPQGIVAP